MSAILSWMGRRLRVDFDAVSDQPVFSLLVDGQSYEAYVYPSDEGWQVLLHGTLYPARWRMSARSGCGRHWAARSPTARNTTCERQCLDWWCPYRSVEGQQIEQGEVLLILESMKMQNELKSPRAGKVSRVRVKTGDSVEQRQPLLSVV